MDLDGLIAIHEITTLKHRYMRTLDQKEWDELEGCLTEDATASYGGGAYECGSRAEIMVFLRDVMGRTSLLTSHRATGPEIDLVAPGEATGTWALQDVVIDLEHGMTITGAAFYSDRYRLTPEGWRISHTGYKRTYEEIFPRASIEWLQVTAHWWETGGRSGLAPS